MMTVRLTISNKMQNQPAAASKAWKVKQIVIPCAGDGTRIAGKRHPKCLLHIGKKPILLHIADAWKRWCREFIVVVPRRHAAIRSTLEKAGVQFKLVVQERPDGAANAVLLAEKHIHEEFMVVLGDCLFDGILFMRESPYPGVAVWKDAGRNEISSNYGVRIKKGRIVFVEEKPKKTIRYFCGMGVYFFGRNVFDVIRNMSATNGKKDITPLLEEYLHIFSGLKPAYFKGQYFNINTRRDFAAGKQCYESKNQ